MKNPHPRGTPTLAPLPDTRAARYVQKDDRHRLYCKKDRLQLLRATRESLVPTGTSGIGLLVVETKDHDIPVLLFLLCLEATRSDWGNRAHLTDGELLGKVRLPGNHPQERDQETLRCLTRLWKEVQFHDPRDPDPPPHAPPPDPCTTSFPTPST